MYRKPYWKCLVKYSAHFVAYVFFYLLNNATKRWDFGRFSRLVNKYLLSFRFTDFLRGSRYFSSIVISINFYYVECGDGRQLLNSEVQNTYVFHSRVSHRAVLLLFFALVRAFAFFLFKAKTTLTLLVLWIFTSNISPHFAKFAGIKLKIISTR